MFTQTASSSTAYTTLVVCAYIYDAGKRYDTQEALMTQAVAHPLHAWSIDIVVLRCHQVQMILINDSALPLYRLVKNCDYSCSGPGL